MFSKLSLAAAVLPLVSALTLNAPTTNPSVGQQVTVTWTTASGDPSVWSLELANPVFRNSIAVLNNVNNTAGSAVFEVPQVTAQTGYTLQAVAISNITDVLSETSSFSINAASSVAGSSTPAGAAGSSTAAATVTPAGTGSSTGAAAAPSVTAPAASVPSSGASSGVSGASLGASSAASSGASSSPSAPSAATSVKYSINVVAVATVALSVIAGFSLAL